MQHPRRSTALLAGAAMVLATLAAPTAAAQPTGSALPDPAAASSAEQPIDPFYTPPQHLPREAGRVVKEQPLTVYGTGPGADGAWPAQGQRVMFTSRTMHDETAPVTGVFLDATGPWRGPGERPTVVIAPGTTGQGDRCAISNALATGLWAQALPEPAFSANQELVSMSLWRSLGARVFVTDYIGLGTPGVHTYLHREETGRAVLDAARAAGQLAGRTGGPAAANAPVLLWGYSQGGGATGAAAELQPSYAPEVPLRAAWVGAPVADPRAVLAHADGGLISGVSAWAINGMAERYPDFERQLDRAINDRGRAEFAEMRSECIGDVILKRPFRSTAEWTVDGRSLSQWLPEVPEATRVLDEQRLGRTAPRIPVLITSSPRDDTVPYGQARRLADDWCAAGTPVTFHTAHFPEVPQGWTLPGHFGPLINEAYVADRVAPWLMGTLDDAPRAGCSID